MNKKCEDKNSEGVCQEWPKDGKSKENMDKTLDTLKRRLEKGSGEVYAYVLTTVNYVLTTVKREDHSGFVQTGSAPNFQGNLITLSTCKHYMRTYKKSPEDWKGVWVAGFIGINTMRDHLNYLFYLMRVQDTFQSHKELWNWLDYSAKKAKNARYNTCGDVYKPMASLKYPFRPSDYYPPIKGHVHKKNNDWHEDINYLNHKTKRRPALLVGDPAFSFLWSQPKIYFKGKGHKLLPRTKKWDNVQDFIRLLVSKERHSK